VSGGSADPARESLDRSHGSGYGLAEKRVLVTGATGGIGTAIARAYAGAGARVALGYASGSEAARSLADELGAGQDRAMTTKYRIGEPATSEQAVESVLTRWGGVDVLILNAMMPGGRRAPGAPFEDLPSQELAAFVSQNSVQTARTIQLALPGMRAAGWGRMVLISSVVATLGKSQRECYGMVKAGFYGLARSLMWDLQGTGILVNTVSPGLTLTTAVEQAMPAAALQREAALTPTGQLSRPADVAAAVLFLGSGANTNITGEDLAVSGGR
jgi:NAD(P)-dependent dehydrogenase (short-subunit alcohol dehydrogenase family)